MSEEEKQAIIHLLDKQARYEYAINNDLSFNDEDYEAYIIRQSMINKDKEIERLKERLEEYQKYVDINHKEIERLNKCIDEALEIIIKDWNDKCTIPIHSVVDTGDDIRIKLYYQLFFKGVDKE